MRKQGINIGDVFGGQLFLDFQAEQGIGTDAPPLQEIILLEHVANRAADVNASFGRGKLPCQHGKNCGFAAARRSDNGYKFARLDGKAQMRHSRGFSADAVVAEADILQRNNGGSWKGPPLQSLILSIYCKGDKWCISQKKEGVAAERKIW